MNVRSRVVTAAKRADGFGGSSKKPARQPAPALSDRALNQKALRRGKQAVLQEEQIADDGRMRMSSRPLLTVRGAGLRLNCSPRTIWRYVRDGEFPVVRFGRATRITESDLQAFIDRHKVKCRKES